MTQWKVWILRHQPPPPPPPFPPSASRANPSHLSQPPPSPLAPRHSCALLGPRLAPWGCNMALYGYTQWTRQVFGFLDIGFYVLGVVCFALLFGSHVCLFWFVCFGDLLLLLWLSSTPLYIALLSVYFDGTCSFKLASWMHLSSPLLPRPRCTRLSSQAHSLCCPTSFLIILAIFFLTQSFSKLSRCKTLRSLGINRSNAW